MAPGVFVLRRIKGSAMVLAAVAAGALLQPAQAQQPALEGAWNGSGLVLLASGNSERARCRARISRGQGAIYQMNAVCATPSVRVSQTATLQRVSATLFRGDFYNAEYNLSGSIAISLRGDQLNARLESSAGSANLSLRR